MALSMYTCMKLCIKAKLNVRAAMPKTIAPITAKLLPLLLHTFLQDIILSMTFIF
jgi:hypothetical protein